MNCFAQITSRVSLVLTLLAVSAVWQAFDASAIFAEDSIDDQLQAIRDANPSKLQREYFVELRTRSQTIADAMNDIFDSDADEEAVLKAYEQVDRMLVVIARAGYRAVVTTQSKLAARLLKDERPKVKLLGQFKQISTRARRIATMTDAQQRKLVDDFMEVLEKADVNRSHMGLAISMGRSLDRYNEDRAYAAATCLEFARIAAESDDDNVKELAAKLEGMNRRLNLLGGPIEITGTSGDGKPFDWKMYKGKVVLIDYWASWCGPCIAELPNVKRMYKAYHDRGFEVVGINLDSKREAYEKFEKDRELPWVNLYGDDADASGWSHPMATKFGVTSIPTVLLVDQKGKVVSLGARGEVLKLHLANLLGSIDEDRTTRDPAATETTVPANP